MQKKIIALAVAGLMAPSRLIETRSASCIARRTWSYSAPGMILRWM